MNTLRSSSRPLVTVLRAYFKPTNASRSLLTKRPRLPAFTQSKTLHRLECRSLFHTSQYQRGVQSFLLADIGEGITECELIQWFVEPGQTVAEFDKICEVQSDKASVEITSRYAGKISKLYHEVHGIAKVGQPLVDIVVEEEGEQSKDTQAIAASSTEHVQQPELHARSSTSHLSILPSVRRLIITNDIPLNSVQGSGKGGRILKSDVLDFINGKSKDTTGVTITASTSSSSPSAESLSMDDNQKDSTTSLSMIQKAMFKSMTASLNIPQLGYKDEIVLNATTEYRSSLNDYLNKHPGMYPFSKISYLPIFMKSLSVALSYYPIMNSRITGDQNDVNSLQIVYRDSHNIGVAMDTPQGLIVPNIKDVQAKTIFQVANELHRLVELGKKNAIPLKDLQGGTITLSNIGAISGTYANPVIVSSEMAIVALGKMQKMPRFDHAGKVVSKEILPISWSADHRIIDGATVARFGNTWKTLVENPALLTSELR